MEVGWVSGGGVDGGEGRQPKASYTFHKDADSSVVSLLK